jgi:hypothetical protein
VETVQAFRARDGALFARLDDCEQHETLLQHGADLEAFKHSELNPYRSNIQATMVKSAILAWERFKLRASVPHPDGNPSICES